MRNLEADYSEVSVDVLLNQLMVDYATDLKRIAFLYINDLSECEDIIQEVYISCYQKLSSFRHECSYKTWLIRITINKCKDYKKRWSIKKLIYTPIISSIFTAPSAEEQFIDKQTSQIMIEQIAKLPTKYKDVLILYYYQQLTMAEISEILDVNMNTIKSRLLRGKKILQNKLERSNASG
ncbi:sigma-70 family RNA polymerase sigma factor [Lysinibacillus piscis]|uniref:RNA polymerase sigma factor n=1 Tax=Lysinibacillus piscis TaxID=2518931 RepID=A0ABQ5NJ44_9BACI|nr:sigma-70 family RNA polymerase sigma factor [Lysinibacillus sp. KH24]GLC88039.1 RNA polymerase sigma factor [Lysinibacillus sp. KH24]